MSVTFTTITGPIKIELNITDGHQLKHVENFLIHCAMGTYVNNQILRYIPQFILQTGDPTNSGKESEVADTSHEYDDAQKYGVPGQIKRGSVMCVNSAKNNDGLGSQFFVVLSDSHKDILAQGDYTLIGEVIDGIESIERIENDAELNDVARAKKNGKVRGKWKHQPWIIDVQIHHNPFV